MTCKWTGQRQLRSCAKHSADSRSGAKLRGGRIGVMPVKVYF
jgi:hypothetical protein